MSTLFALSLYHEFSIFVDWKAYELVHKKTNLLENVQEKKHSKHHLVFLLIYDEVLFLI